MQGQNVEEDDRGDGEVLDGVSNDDLKLVIVMIVTPGVMNVFQFCVRRALPPRPTRSSNSIDQIEQFGISDLVYVPLL